MSANDVVCDGVRILLKETSRLLPVRGLGVIQQDGPAHVVLTYADAFGLTGHRSRVDAIPTRLRPADFSSGPATIALDRDHEGVVETRLLHTGFAQAALDEIGNLESLSVKQLLAVAVPNTSEPAVLLVGLGESLALTAEQTEALDRAAQHLSEFLRRTETDQDQREHSRRLEAVARMLPALFRVLDVRQIFDQLSTIAKDVLRHDFATIGLFPESGTRLELYVQTAGGPWEFRSGPMPFPTVQTDDWLYRLVDNLTENPLERRGDSTRAGGIASIRVAIRLEDSILGAVNFTSRSPEPYTATDLVVCRRIADYVALALSHQRLAEEARLNEELRARAASLELLDELLSTLGDSGELHEVLSRMSPLARKVLPHDGLIELSVSWSPDREFDLIDDATTATTPAGGEIAVRGFQSALGVPVRVDGRVVAVVAFVARAPASFKAQDLPIARRIADRIALSVSHERGRDAAKRADEATARAAQLESRVRALTDELDARTGFRRIIGESPGWRQVLTQATQVAATDTTVLLLGESGTGKEVVARFLHRASSRSSGPFIALNCAALPEQLLEAELFGYERGAFTGALQSKPGQLEIAAGGTLFLDEVGEMSPSAQAKCLRVLQEREFQRLGGTRVLRSDARIVAATNRDLVRAIANGQFREDLSYRLNVFAVRLPALRDRRDDILRLSDVFLSEVGRGLGRPPAGVSREARQALTDYHWPGNVRELRNILERAAILCDGGLITTEHLAFSPLASPRTIGPAAMAIGSAPASVESVGDLQSLERGMVEQALQKARFNKSKAAKALGLTRQQLYVRMRRYGLE